MVICSCRQSSSALTPVSDKRVKLERLSVFDFSDFLCIWNTNFQTLQAGKEMAGKIYGQVGRASLAVLITGGQGSLSFQLLGADGGLYDFGRALSALHREWSHCPSSQLYSSPHS